MLEDFTVIPQRGKGFAERLSKAHAEAGALAGAPVLQIGMDTPQVSPEVLSDAASLLADDDGPAVFGPAVDGGWWALGLADPRVASALEGVAMSRPDTGRRTLAALADRGVVAVRLPELADVDSSEDVWSVAGEVGEHSHFRLAVRPLPTMIVDSVIGAAYQVVNSRLLMSEGPDRLQPEGKAVAAAGEERRGGHQPYGERQPDPLGLRLA